MVITHNMSAINSQRQLFMISTSKNKSSEKLASGYRINRAADDAAGLSISEKMRNQIRGLNQAVNNCEDGIALVQTAEGALSEMHSILKRMRELVVQGANDTNAYDDREAIQNELDLLKQEINGISDRTEFNGKKLLNGNLSERKPLNGKSTVELSMTMTNYWTNKYIYDDAGNLYKNDNSGREALASYLDANPTATLYKAYRPRVSYKLQGNDEWVFGRTGMPSLDEQDKWLEDEEMFTYIQEENCMQSDKTGIKYNPREFERYIHASEYSWSFDSSSGLSTGDKFWYLPVSKTDKQAIEGIDYMYTSVSDAEDMDGNLILQVGANAGENMVIGIDAINVNTLGIGSISVVDHETASISLGALDGANDKVSALRSKLGAIQNRLDFTVNNLTNYSENLQNAESNIRDTDMALEMVQYSKSNILQQVAQSMLSHTNQDRQGVLQLLQM